MPFYKVVGFVYYQMCNKMDMGFDPRRIEVGEIINTIQEEFGPSKELDEEEEIKSMMCFLAGETDPETICRILYRRGYIKL